MFRVLFGLTIGFWATASAAQDTAFADSETVRSCLATTPVGIIYPACLGAASKQCPNDGTTLGMVGCIQAETAHWDALLNDAYQARQTEFAAADLAASPTGVDRTDALRDAQRAWIAFRDADCARAYAQWQDGSIRNVVAANCIMVMTAVRTLQLRDMN